MRHGSRRIHLRRGSGQALILVVLALPLFFALCAVVVDGTSLMVNRRQMQNAADAAALAAVQELTPAIIATEACAGDEACLTGVRATPPPALGDTANEYVAKNWAGGSTPPTLSRCLTSEDTNCWSWPYEKGKYGVDPAPPYGPGAYHFVQVKLRRPVGGFFTGVINMASTFVVGARAVAAANAIPGIEVVPGSPGTPPVTQTYTTTGPIFIPGPLTGIFARSQVCNSFFIPGDNVHVTGVSTFGGIGNVSNTGNHIDAIQMNHFFYDQNGCSYSVGAAAPDPPEFWCYSDPGHVPCDGPGPGGWPVPFPERAALYRSADSHCLYMNKTNIASKAFQSGQATVTMTTPHCLQVGDAVTVNLTDNRFDCTACAVTAATDDSFSYARSFATFSRTVTTKALQSGVATLTLSGTTPLFTVGDNIDVTGVDSTFNGTYTVLAATASTVQYSKTIPPVNLNVTTKVLASGVATLTTSVAHRLTVGDSVTVNINDSRFDGTYTVTVVPSATTFRYSPTTDVLGVTNASVASGVATLTTSGANNKLKANDVVTVNLGDERFDGGPYTLTGATATTFSYTLPTFKDTRYDWTLATQTVKLTTAVDSGLQPGDVVRVSGIGAGTPGGCMNNTTTGWTVTAATHTAPFTFSYKDTVCTMASVGANDNKATITIWTVNSAAASGNASVVSVASAAASGTVTVPGFIASTASGGTVSFTGTVAPSSGSGSVIFGANTAIATGWTTTHPPGIYVLDAANGVALTISASGTNFDGYTFVAPEISITGSNNTFTKFSTAAQQALFLAYDPNGDAVHNSNVNHFIGSIFCGPEADPGPDPTNKCWFGGDGTTFDGLMEAWRIEYTCDNCDMDGTGPPIGGTTTTGTTTTVVTIPGTPSTPGSTNTVTVGTTYAMDE